MKKNESFVEGVILNDPKLENEICTFSLKMDAEIINLEVNGILAKICDMYLRKNNLIKAKGNMLSNNFLAQNIYFIRNII